MPKKTWTAKFDGKCALCTKPIKAGNKIINTVHGGWAHPHCQPVHELRSEWAQPRRTGRNTRHWGDLPGYVPPED